jgi:hypothetical protein
VTTSVRLASAEVEITVVIRNDHEPSWTSTMVSATRPWASRCTSLAASAFGPSTRQWIVRSVSETQILEVCLGDVLEPDGVVEVVGVHE